MTKYLLLIGLPLFAIGVTCDCLLDWCPGGHETAKIGMLLFAVGMFRYIRTPKKTKKD